MRTTVITNANPSRMIPSAIPVGIVALPRQADDGGGHRGRLVVAGDGEVPPDHHHGADLADRGAEAGDNGREHRDPSLLEHQPDRLASGRAQAQGLQAEVLGHR